jgi:hypothetical protein
MTHNPTDKPSPRRSMADLPQKTCAACGRQFTWRRKWARDWDSVRYFSERCRRGKGQRQGTSSA